MQRKSRFEEPEGGDQDPGDAPACDLLSCRERCGRVQVQLVFGEGMYAIYCPRGWIRTLNYPEAGNDTIQRTDFEKFQVFLRFVHSRAYIRAALQRAASGGEVG